MKRYFILLLSVACMASCKKGSNGTDSPGGGNGSVVNFKQIGSSTSSSAIITGFTSNKKGNAFLVTLLDENNAAQTYYGSGSKWEKLGAFNATDAAISETGVVLYFERAGLLKRYTGSGSPEQVSLTGFNYSRVEIGMDGNFYAGTSNGKIYKSSDEGKTWTATEIPDNRFNYSGNLAVGFFVYPDGKMFSYTSGGRVYQSTDGGKSWPAVNITVDYSNSGYTDIYSAVSHDDNGYIYILGASGVSVINTSNMSSRSVSFQSAQLNSNYERLEKFATDGQGQLYAVATNKGYDYEHKKTGASIFKFIGGAWQKLATPYPYTGFSGMNIQATQAGIISAANGLESKGLYSVNTSGSYTALGSPVTLENIVQDMAPLQNGKVFAVVRHATPIGSTLSQALNPAYASLMVLENGQWKHTGRASDKVFVASNGDIYSMHNVEASVSKDGGSTWQTSTIAVDDPLNLRNFLNAEVLHMTELKGKLYAYFQLAYGGVSGTYVNYSWSSALLGSSNFEKLTGRAGNYRPSTSQIPLTTAAKGTTGFYFQPFNNYTYFPSQPEEVFFTKDGGDNYTLTGFPLVFAGSNSGSYVAWGAGGFFASTGANPTSFSKIQFKLPQGEIDMNKYNGINYFTTWGRFGIDNKLYFNLDSKVYVSEGGF